MAWRVVICLVLVVLAGCGADYGVDQNGKVVKAGQLDDQWLVVNYWADW